MKDSSNVDGKLDKALEGVSADEARRLREMWEIAGTLEVEGSADRMHLDRVRDNLNQFAEEGSQTDQVDAHQTGFAADRGASTNGRLTGRRPARLIPLALSAAAAIALVAFSLWWWNSPVVWSTGPGENIVVSLPDGSNVELNSASTISHDRNFAANQRTIQLDGDAFFEVARAGSPFVINTFNAEIQVLGTAFNVRARSDEADAGTIVALKTGRLSLQPVLQPNRNVVMSAGDIRRVVTVGDEATIDSVSSAIDDATAWMRGDFVFRDQPLQLILSDIRRRYGIEIRSALRADDGRRWNLALRQPEDAESVVRDVAGITGLRYRRTSRGFELYREAR